MDEQISNILKNISTKEIRTMEEVRQGVRDAVEDIFGDFMCYKNNEVNRKMALIELEDYEIINLHNIHKHDEIIYFKTRNFFNIQLVKGSAINVLSGDRLSVKTKGKIYHVRCKYYFRKLTEEDKIKISLVEAICDN
jgi:hypothetical protein